MIESLSLSLSLALAKIELGCLQCSRIAAPVTEIIPPPLLLWLIIARASDW